MAFFEMSAWTGCTSPADNETSYSFKYNDAEIVSYHKKDGSGYYGVVCVFTNKTEIFKFDNINDRDGFYSSLP